jgi:hypothetical protein
MSDVFDLDALAHEANGEPFRFRFGGEDYELPPHMDIRAVAAMSAGRLDDALRMLLGDAQWTRLQASPEVFDQHKLLALFNAYGAHSGMTPGESSASTGSSASTPNR